MNTNKPTMYHGSDHLFRVDEIVKPSIGYAFATTDLECAQSFGEHVFVVEPTEHIEHDSDMHNEPGADFRSATGFIVKSLYLSGYDYNLLRGE